jgi:formylglycine-generating enzyme required for sulfatase activity
MLKIDGGEFNQKAVDWEGNISESFNHTISGLYTYSYQVTYRLWYKVYRWAIDRCYAFANAGMEGSVTGGGEYPHYQNIGKTPSPFRNEPVTMVSWSDCIVWCNAYSEMDGWQTVYHDVKGKPLTDSRNVDICDKADPDWSANGYRLPTEGEWQFCAGCNGYTPPNNASGAEYDYRDHIATNSVAWYKDNSGGKTHDVGTKRANSFGLYDMSGNVSEWCWDRYGSYPSRPCIDYRGSKYGHRRVRRGGSWNDVSEFLRIGCRLAGDPCYGLSYIGFRLVRHL